MFRATKTPFFLILAGICALKVAAQEKPGPSVIPICNVLRNPSSFNGKVIALRGERIVGGHALYLHGQNCSDVLTTKGYRWPSLIWIVNIAEELESHGYNVGQFVAAIREIDNASRGQLQKRGVGAKIAHIDVTFVGLFETHRDFDSAIFDRPDGSVMGAGFGPVPGALGQLFVQSVRDISIKVDSNSSEGKR